MPRRARHDDEPDNPLGGGESAQSRYAARKAAGLREIGRSLERGNMERWWKCRTSFRLFCESYMPETFALEWSADHLRVIEKIERAVIHGELFAMAMPRGSGKSSMVEAAAQWALLYGWRKFVTIVGSDEPSAESMLDSISMELETNERFAEDFPEVIAPIVALEGIHQRAGGQTWKGERTRMSWTAKRIILPTVRAQEDDDGTMGAKVGKLYPTSGGIIDVAGITGRLRGRKHKRPNGSTIRPDLVLIDDPQTDESARSPSQVQARLKTMSGAILGLAGPGKKIAGLCTVTVISPSDLADQILDQQLHPQWQGERTKLMYQEPSATGLWEEYDKLRLAGLRDGVGLSLATAFYVQNREAMDSGAVVAWEQRFNPDEVSAIQHAMNLKLSNEASFLAEYQNEPLPPADQMGSDLTREGIMGQLSGLPRWCAPDDATHVTVGIDVQSRLLYFGVGAFLDDLTGAMIGYGSWPDQARPYYSLRDARDTITSRYKGTEEERIIQALHECVEWLCRQQIRTSRGTPLAIGRIFVDSGNWTEAIYQACRTSKHAGILMPYKGVGITASNVPMHEYPRKRGEKRGEGWIVTTRSEMLRGLRLARVDTNHWKTKMAKALSTKPGEPGSLSLHGTNPRDHELLADHILAEYQVTTTGRGRTIQEWKHKPGKPDNHLLDTTQMAMSAASVDGAGVVKVDVRPREKVSFAEMQRKKREQRLGRR